LIAVPAAGDLLVVAVADADVNVGLLRLELRRVAEQLA
jgi:predicted regulator of Ras-like GTPase activity (Roadblock/LC7/MglB family)